MIPKSVLLGLAWCAFHGHLAWDQFAFGTLLGFVLLLLTGQRGPAALGAVRRLPALLGLGLFFLKELVVANVRVARAVVGNKHALRPAVVRVPLEGFDARSATVLANLITLTPGTLSLDVEPEQRALLVHCLDVQDPDAVREEIQRGFARRVKEVFA